MKIKKQTLDFSNSFEAMEIISSYRLFEEFVRDLESIEVKAVKEEKYRHCRTCVHDNDTGIYCFMGKKPTGTPCEHFR